MQFLRQARLQRMLERHSNVTVVEPEPGRQAVIRRNQILVADRDRPRVDEKLARWIAGRDESAGISRLHLRAEAGIDVCELTYDLQGASTFRRLSLSPNHILHGEPQYWGGPVGIPEPVTPLPSPRGGEARRRATVAVLDTGLSPHPWFDDEEWYRAQRSDHIAEVLDADLDYELDSQAGHGTFVAGLVAQRAPDARMRIGRLLGSDGICDELQLVGALADLRAWSSTTGTPIDVVNLSLGGYTFDDRPSPLVSNAIRGFGRQTVVVACAGNNASDRPFWPAALGPVVSVAALDPDGAERAEFSNYGWWVDACAIGEQVSSTFVHFNGPEPPSRGADPDLFRGYASWSGTSFAAPQVAGTIAALIGTGDLAPAAAADKVLDPASHDTIPDLGVVVRQ